MVRAEWCGAAVLVVVDFVIVVVEVEVVLVILTGFAFFPRGCLRINSLGFVVSMGLVRFWRILR